MPEKSMAKRTIRAAAGNRCKECGMLNSHHLLLTGKCLHSHRLKPGSTYRAENCQVLCFWCHQKTHGHTAKAFPAKYYPLRLESHGTLHVDLFENEELKRIKRLSRLLHLGEREVLYAALALLEIEAEKFLGKSKKQS